MKLPEKVRHQALEWLAATRFNGNAPAAAEVIDALCQEDAVQWQGGSTFSLDDTSPTVARIAPELLNRKALLERGRAGDRAAFKTLVDHDIRRDRQGFDLGASVPRSPSLSDHPNHRIRNQAIHDEIESFARQVPPPTSAARKNNR